MYQKTTPSAREGSISLLTLPSNCVKIPRRVLLAYISIKGVLVVSSTASISVSEVRQFLAGGNYLSLLEKESIGRALSRCGTYISHNHLYRIGKILAHLFHAWRASKT